MCGVFLSLYVVLEKGVLLRAWLRAEFEKLRPVSCVGATNKKKKTQKVYELL